MRLKVYEINAIVDSVFSKLNEKEREKLLKPEIKKEVDEINEELGNDIREINLLIEKFKRKREERYGYFREKFGNNSGYYFNMSGVGIYSFSNDSFISDNKGDLVNWSVKEKIRNKVILSNIKGDEVDKLIDDLVREFSN